MQHAYFTKLNWEPRGVSMIADINVSSLIFSREIFSV